MKWVKSWGLLLAVGCFLGAQTAGDDPVEKARLQRSQAQGIDEADLPPVPRAILEPPALPPPETHAKDLPHPRVTKADRRRGAGKGKPGKHGKSALPPESKAARHAAPAAPASKVPHRTGRRAKK